MGALPTTAETARLPVWRGLIRTARPRQWSKNLLVFGAPAAAGALTHRSVMVDATLAFVSFCLAASGMYFLNDAADVESDRQHTRKRLRPMAAGVFSPTTGRVAGALLVAASLAVAATTERGQLLLAVALYVANVTAYSVWLKHIAILDVMSVAAGFLIRAIAGGAATKIPLSGWFLLVASFGSMYLVVGKRFAEHRTYFGDDGLFKHGSTRPVMLQYPREFLVYLRSVSSGALLVAYCLFVFQKVAQVPGAFPWYQLSVIPFLGGVLRYGLLIEQGSGEEPDELLFRDLGLLLAGVLWFALFALGVYLGG